MLYPLAEKILVAVVAGVPALLIAYGLVRLLYWPIAALMFGEYHYDDLAPPLTRRGVLSGALTAPLYIGVALLMVVATGLVVTGIVLLAVVAL